MLPEQHIRDEPCPVHLDFLGQLYRTSPRGLDELIVTVPAEARARLALYCYRRAHLQSIGLAIAASCYKDDLEMVGGRAGLILFEDAREAPEEERDPPHLIGRRKVTLSSGILRVFAQDADLPQEASVAL